MIRRVWLTMLALCVLLLSVGCDNAPALPEDDTRVSQAPVVDTPDEPLVFALAYSHDDTLNPYAATTEVNLQLAYLLYDSLTVITDGYVPALSLASEIVASDATHVVVTLREDAVFSDGSAVTVEDVVKSFQAAQTSPNYAALVSNITSAKGDGKKRQITFALAVPDIHAQASLTFPIVKASTLSDKAATAPVGGGLYMTQQTDDGLLLVKNPHDPTEVNFPQVVLRHLPNNASRYYALASGQLAYYFDDLSEGETPRVMGASRPIELNTRLLLGINSAHEQLALPAVRQALSLMLDRSDMAAVYGEGGVAVTSLLPTVWQPMEECVVPSAEQDVETAKALLTEAGYPLKGKNQPELRLIYRANRKDRSVVAEQIRVQAAACGVQITPVALSEAEYYQALVDGEYELYLGEFRPGADMSLRALLLGGETSYGVAEDSAAKAAYFGYLAGDVTLQEFLDAFSADMPYIPLCGWGGVAAYDRRLTEVTPTGYNPYYGIAAWG